jgi:preprotein translocase subunit SecF
MKDITSSLYNKYYKLILIIPALMLLFSLGYLYTFNSATGDIIKKDVSLTGGTSVTVFDKNSDINMVKSELTKEFPDLLIRGISDIGTGSQKGFTVETKSSVEVITASLEKLLGYKLTDENSSVEFSGETLSQGFYKQIINSIIAAFLLMAWVVFLIFADSRKMKGYATMLTFLGVVISLYEVNFLHALSVMGIIFGAGYSLYKTNSKGRDYLLVFIGAVAFITLIFVAPYYILLLPIGAILVGIYIYSSIPSFAVILSAFADIVMTLTTVNLLDMSISSAGIVAFLMLIGYSVDTDILLTTRLLKKSEGSVNERIWGAFKTGMSMVSTSIAAVAVSLIIIYNLSDTLRQIFTILLIGLVYDIFNTWITNTSMLKWYMEVKNIR